MPETFIVQQLIVLLVISVYMGKGARRRGYSGLLWFVPSFLSPWFTLGLIAALPDRRLERRREEDIAALRLEAAQVQPTTTAAVDVVDGTVGDQLTVRL